MKIATPQKMIRKAGKAIGQGRAPDPKKIGKGLSRVSKGIKKMPKKY